MSPEHPKKYVSGNVNQGVSKSYAPSFGAPSPSPSSKPPSGSQFPASCLPSQ